MSTRNSSAPTGVSPDASVPPIRSWSDGYAALRRRAGDTRGWIELDSDAPDRRWPRTTGLDVIVIAAFVDAAFSNTDQVTYAGTALRWASCKGDIERDALQALGETYGGNRDFWSCLAMMCAHLAFVGCPLPSRRAWNAVLSEIGVGLPTRNALAKDRPPVWFANMATLDDLMRAQRKYLSDLHGFDKLAPEPSMTGGVTIVPRSTNGEVLQIAEFWTQALNSKKSKNLIGFSTVRDKWDAALRDINTHARGANPNAVYPKNHAFWRSVVSVAIHTAVATEHNGLSDAEKWMAAAGDALQTAIERVKSAAPAIAASVRDTAVDAAHAAGRVVHEGARGLLGGLATPLLIGGGVITAIVLLRGRGEPARGEQR